ncbi:MAG: methyltransferase domain-containing protein [Candidatus Rokubacteria bacterium]|nr:methyltransferase domain-containing protein [Candidatus Rokubacteria bacterium]
MVSVHADLDDQRRYERGLRHHARRWFEAFTLPRASRVIRVSEYLRRYVTRYGARSVDVIYNRVDTEAFRAGSRSAMSAPPVVLSVSRLVRQKAPECLLRAVRGLDVRLVLIGDGDRAGEVSALAERLDLQDQVARGSPPSLTGRSRASMPPPTSSRSRRITRVFAVRCWRRWPPGGESGERFHILDAGCGDGVITSSLRCRFPAAEIDALDADEVRFTRARAYCEGVDFRLGEVDALPYGDATFDVVVCHRVVEHIPDDTAVLRGRGPYCSAHK